MVTLHARNRSQHAEKVTYLNFKNFSRLLNKTYDSELSFVSRKTMQ